MTLAEKRKEIYALINDRVKNKQITKNEWYAFQEDLSKLLKAYSDTPVETVIYKEKIVYKDRIIKQKPKEDNYWGI